jgi:hypothetical protein
MDYFLGTPELRARRDCSPRYRGESLATLGTKFADANLSNSG